MAHGTPVIVVAGADNAAVELVAEGQNGVIAPSPSPDDLAAAIVRVHAEGETLRASTASWFAQNAERLSLRHSLDEISRRYARA
jgi:glycosyltransferase involved in cell wall biosynthesis